MTSWPSEWVPVVALGTYSLVSVVMWAPQLWRTWRTRDVAGLSGSGLLLNLSAYMVWNAYLAAGAAWSVLAANSVGSLLVAGSLWAAWRAGLGFEGAWRLSGLMVVVMGVAALVDYRALGLGLAALSFVAWVPVVARLWWDVSVSGASVVFWLVTFAHGVSAVTLGLIGHPVALLATGAASLMASGLALLAIGVRRVPLSVAVTVVGEPTTPALTQRMRPV